MQREEDRNSENAEAQKNAESMSALFSVKTNEKKKTLKIPIIALLDDIKLRSFFVYRL